MGHQTDQEAFVFALDRYCAGSGHLAALLDFEQRGTQLQTQFRQNEGQQITRQLPTPMAQKASGTLTHVQDIGAAINDDARWRRLLKGTLVNVGD
ncbi:hypothetical protein D3C84_1136730 [compost metagenome]